MGFFVVDPNGNITAVSDSHLANGIEYNVPEDIANIKASMNDYKWVDDTLIHAPMPDHYHSWNGTEWEYNPELFADAQMQVEQKILALRDKLKYEGYQATLSTGQWWIQNDEVSRTQQLGLAAVAALTIFGQLGVPHLPAFPANGVMWKTMNLDSNERNIVISMTLSDVLIAFATELQYESAMYTNAERHLEIMLASNDPLNYDYSGGWPPVYPGS